MRCDYDMVGNRIHQVSMEAAERWMLNNVAGKTIRAWDSRGFTRRMTYDELRRPTKLFVTENGAERLAEQTVYGESQGAANNHCTRVFQVFDAAGVVTSELYDFKGNLKSSRRELLRDYKNAVDWKTNPVPNDGTFTTRTTYDALNRPLTVESAGQPSVRITVQDLGSGIEAENMEHLFEAFYSTKPHGMGMGLRISRSIVEAHGGRLWVAPNAGTGVAVLFALPAES
jgi:hypothetical protein